MKYVTWGLLALVMALFAALSISHKAHQKDIAHWQNLYAKSVDSLTTIVVGGDSAMLQMAITVDRISEENEAVKASLKDSGSKLRYLAKINASYKADLTNQGNISTIDTVYVTEDGDSIRSRHFSRHNGVITVVGNFDKYSPWDIRFENISIDSLSFKLGVAESKNGLWTTYILDSTSGLLFEKVEAQVVPYKPSWYSAFHLNVEVNSDGGGLGAGYGPFTGMYYIDGSVGLEYQYQIWK